MSFDDHVYHMQDLFYRSDFDTVNELYPLNRVTNRKKVFGCVLLARRDRFDVVYAEVESNPESIAGDLAKSHLTPCLVITRADADYVFTVMDYDTSKPVHAKAGRGEESRMRELVKYIGDIDGDSWGVNHELVRFIKTMNDF